MSGARPDPKGQSAGGTRRAVAFVAIAYALAWLVCLPLWLRGAGLTQPLTTILGVIMMLTPTAAALIVHRATGGRRLTDVLGLRLGPWRRWLPYALLAWLGPVVLAFLAVALAAALGVFETIEHDGLLARARDIGVQLTGALGEISATSEVVGDIRGRGAMVAAELVRGPGKTPNPDALNAIVGYARDRGVLLLKAGTYGNVLRFLPPLVMPEEMLGDALGVVADAFAAL